MEELDIKFQMWKQQNENRDELLSNLKISLEEILAKSVEFNSNFSIFVKENIKDASILKEEMKNKIMEGVNNEIK